MAYKKIFETKVIKVGTQAPALLKEANMIILFGLEAPEDLAEYCYKITHADLKEKIQVGSCLAIDQQYFPITAIGNVVENNLVSLGHMTISFDGSKEETLPGTLHVEKVVSLKISENSTIQILNGIE